MFDVGFSELVVCFVVALVVLGPEKLPGVARTVGRWTGIARGYLRNLTAELEREAHAADLKQQFEQTRQALKDGSDALRDAAREVTREVTHDRDEPPK